jgi:hypothetical protein
VERASSDDESQRMISQNQREKKFQKSQPVQVIEEDSEEEEAQEELEWDEVRDRVVAVKDSEHESFHEESDGEEKEVREEADVSQLLFHDRQIGKNKRRALVVDADSEGDGNGSDLSDYREMGEFIVFGDEIVHKKRRSAAPQRKVANGTGMLRRIIRDSEDEED